MMCAYSPSWISANFMPEYSTRKPATSSDSASRMSNGTRFSAASVGDDEGEERELADHRIEDEPQARLRRGDVGQLQRAGQHHRHQRREDERQVVGDDLVHRAHRREQRVLVVRAPAGHEQADDLHRRHREEEQDADVEVGDAQSRARTESSRRSACTGRGRRSAPGCRPAGRPPSARCPPSSSA